MKPFRLAVLAPLLLLGGCTVSHIQDSDNTGGGLFSTDSSAGAPADARDTGARSGNDKPAAVAPRPYRYYPAVFVYFDADRALYFFPLNKKWTTAPEIPESFKLETRKFVTIQVASEKPYLLNKAHRKLYPPPKPVKKVVKKPVPAVAPVSSTEPAAATPAEATPSAAATPAATSQAADSGAAAPAPAAAPATPAPAATPAATPASGAPAATTP